MAEATRLLLATENPGKATELLLLFQGIPYEIVTPQQIGMNLAVPETGATLEENAREKARTYAGASGLLTVADDSGLEVDALQGKPGVRSKRYAGERASDEQRVTFLLRKLKDVAWEKRTARFRCVMAITGPSTRTNLCEGECRGFIAFQPRGTGGFGYDPVFYLPELDKTMAELPMETKNQISHRARAAQKARLILEKLMEETHQ